MKKMISMVLSVALLVSNLPAFVLAEEVEAASEPVAVVETVAEPEPVAQETPKEEAEPAPAPVEEQPEAEEEAAEPENAVEPEAPVEPETPVEAEEPVTPAEPAEEETPAETEEPETPAEEEVPEQGEEQLPEEEELPEKPVEEEQKPEEAAALPVAIGLTAVRGENDAIELKWALENWDLVDHLELQYGADETFPEEGDVVTSVALGCETEYVLEDAAEIHALYFRVRTWSADGDCGNWSEVGSFIEKQDESEEPAAPEEEEQKSEETEPEEQPDDSVVEPEEIPALPVAASLSAARGLNDVIEFVWTIENAEAIDHLELQYCADETFPEEGDVVAQSVELEKEQQLYVVEEAADIHTLYFRVRAWNAEGECGEWSETGCFADELALNPDGEERADSSYNYNLPKPVSFNAYCININTIKVSWEYKKTTGVNDLELQYSEKPAFPVGVSTKTLILPATDTNCEISSLTPGSTLYFRIRARDAEGKYAEWFPFDDEIKATTFPEAPETFEYKALSHTSLRLLWTPVPNVAGYIIYRNGVQVKKLDARSLVLDADGFYHWDNGSLTRGETYLYSIASYIRANNKEIPTDEEDRNNMNCEVAPLAPANLEVKALGAGSVKLTWKASTGANGYNVYMENSVANPNPKDFEKIGSVSTTEFIIDKNIWPGKSYDFYVTATYNTTFTSVNEEGETIILPGISVESAPSQIIEGFEMRAPAPGRITNKHFTDHIRIEWDGIDGADGYLLEYSNDKSGPWTKLADISRNNADYIASENRYYYEDGEITLGEERYYRVSAYVSDTVGTASDIVFDALMPAAPTDVDVDVPEKALDKLLITWRDDKNPAGTLKGYELERTTDGKKAGLKYLDSPDGSVLEFTDSTLKVGTTYYYRVRGYYITSSGTKYYSDYSEESAFHRAQPCKVMNVTATPDPNGTGENKFKIDWDLLPGAGSYRVYMYQDGDTKGKLLATLGSNKYTYTATGLKMGSEYEFGVAACKSGTSVYGDITMTLAEKLEIPQVQKFTYTPVNSSSVKLSWKALSGITGYILEISSKEDVGYTKNLTTRSTSVTLSGLKRGFKYEAKIWAYSTVGDHDEKCDLETMPDSDIVIKPSTPSILKAVKNKDEYSIDVSWKAVDEVTKMFNESVECGYVVYRSDSATGTYTKIAWVGADSDKKEYQWTDDTVSATEAGTTFYYKVASYIRPAGEAVESALSKHVYTKLTAPQVQNLEVSVVKDEKDQLMLTWDSVDDCDGYIIYRSTSKGGKYQNIADTTNTEYVDENLSFGKNYFYKVVAYNLKSDVQVEGNPSDIVSCKPALYPPDGATISANQVANTVKDINVKWDPVPGATAYNVYKVDGYGKVTRVKGNVKSLATTISGGFTTDVDYTFRVSAICNGVEGPMSEDSAPITIIVPDVADLSYSVVNTTSFKLTWTKIKNASYYVVEAKLPKETEWETIFPKTTSNAVTVKNRDFGIDYDIRVTAAVKESGITDPYFSGNDPLNVQWTEINEVHTTPLAPSSFSASSITSSSVTLNWSTATSAEGYVIYLYDADGTQIGTKSVDATPRSYTWNGLDSYTKYSFRIRSTYTYHGNAYCNDEMAPLRKAINVTTKK